MASNFSLGQVVQSKAGRDKEKLYVVVDIEGNQSFLYLADGETRKVEKPKKKNPRHLNRLNLVIEEIKAKEKAGMRITNSEIASALQKVREKDHNNKEV